MATRLGLPSVVPQVSQINCVVENISLIDAIPRHVNPALSLVAIMYN